MHAPQAIQAAHLAALEGAILALLRAAQEEGMDGLSIDAQASSGQISIDLSYTSNGMPMSGQSL